MKIVNEQLYLTQLEYDTLIKSCDYFNSPDPELSALGRSLRKSLNFPRHTLYMFSRKITSIIFWNLDENGDVINYTEHPFETWKIYE